MNNTYIIKTMRKTFFVILSASFIFCFILPSFAEEAQAPSSKSASPLATQEEPAKLVAAIEVKGNKAISTNTIISKMKTRIGSPYQENVISDDLKRLYLLNFFSDIKIDSESYKDGLKVIVTVTERPIIDKITFSGINRITLKDEKLKAQLKSKEGQYLDYPSLAEDVRIFEKMYEKIGFSAAKIDYKLDIDEHANKAKIHFNVVEGAKVRIKNITIEGNKAFTSGRILKLLKTKRAWFFNAGVLKDDVLKEDIERIKAFYLRNGYIDVAVDYEVKPDTRKPYLLYVTIKIKEGTKYLVGNVTIQGNNDITEKEIIMRLKECVTGKTFSDEGMKSDVAGIQGLYFDRGYISAQVKEASSLNAAINRVDINYSIVENQITYVDKIKVRGNIKTKDVIVRREMRIHPGDRFDGEKLRRSKERLNNLGFFEEIGYDTEDTDAPDKKNLIVDVKEAKTGSFSFGGGYSTVDAFVGFVEVEQKNFDWKNWPYFTGAGEDLRLRASIGTMSSGPGLELSFTEPWLFDYPVSFGFDAYKRSHKRDADVGYGYDEDVTGGDLRLGKELSEYLRADIMYRVDSIDISNIITDNTASDDLNSEAGTNLVSSITPSLTFDSRDNVFDTHKGNLFSGSLEFAGLGGDKNYYKFFGRASHYFPMFRNSTLEIRGRVGLAEPYGNSEKIPIYERFFGGGAYTIRGYEERAVGPVDASGNPLGGASMLIGNVEYVYPLFGFLKVAAFYDVGNVWEKLGDIGSSKDANGRINSGGFKSGFGLGFRVKTPIGPIMLDYGIPMNKASGKDSKGSGQFYFSVSNSF
ncbi:MAG: outer membrane protein assembly factor BamA [Candidatus Omnitrophica bacterium CG08_land_8_20_14_0_20_41_16]|uniref:Outer membrane protein assembly factor BamA n=1 Tax=Candidatus Sherwoodlollariibacterium unditelluris TaxID=1974757 RepID=A0A2G9YKB1_9BACT|nr:MAG: outer membrane protein assembly factor BamA [Candidatus Omnitrophica bacterium CG23_combo_of_CG06-09_8_20_14_all_41_10]PIS33784.1 MAG: outer membrane protein assembly factor BamA [Candidatus Omnitrophica bacterium CG08_land_8_20_14_0_20_41_16]